jgi:YVTN family beta-propeller protein
MTVHTRRAVVASLALTPILGALPRWAAAKQASPTAGGAQIVVLSNSSPHVSAIDATTLEIVATADLPAFTSWTWNDDNNYSDGRQLWLGTQNPDTKAVEVIALDLDDLRVMHRIPLGTEEMTLYLSRGGKDGRFYVGKMGAGQVVAIDPKTATAVQTWDVPVNSGVVCDIDVATGPDGVERVFYPTWTGDTVAIVDPQTGQVPTVSSDFPEGGGPWMNTAAPDGRLWVQWEKNTNDVREPTDLSLVKRIPVGEQPTNATFSPDGRYAYITHLADTIVTVVDTKTLEKVEDVQVGTNPWLVAVDPNGKTIYAIVTKESAIAVIDTATWKVTRRVNIGTNPSGIFLRPPSA